MSAAFLPFLKKQPAPAIKPAPQQQEEEDPLAVPLPPCKPSSKLTTANSKFVSHLNGRSHNAKPPASPAGGQLSAPPKRSGTAKPGIAAAASVQRQVPSKAKAERPTAGLLSKGLTAGTAVALSPAAAKAEVEKRRLKQLERLAALGALAPKGTPPEVLAKYEQAKQQLAEIKQQQELAAKRRLHDEQRRQQLEAKRRKLEQEKLRLAEEKQRLRLGVASGAGPTKLTAPPPGSGMAAAGPRRRPQAAGNLSQPAGAGGRGPGPAAQSSAAIVRQPGPRHTSQSPKDPYAHLNAKQRAFLLARKREREGRMNGRMGSSGRHRGSSADGFGSDLDEYSDDEFDDLMDFIDDDDDIDWRSQLRATTGYDPRKYQDSFYDDRKMQASAAEIAAEERRSARLGKAEDEKEAEAEARRTAAKEAKRSRRRGASALFDD